MKTYLKLWFSSDGASPTIIEKKLKELGFSPMTGPQDLEYPWDGQPSVDDILSLGNLIQKKLKGSNILFKMKTE